MLSRRHSFLSIYSDLRLSRSRSFSQVCRPLFHAGNSIPIEALQTGELEKNYVRFLN